jgi:peptidoglycan hydrolase-like protein with peptidoglycan-binding domain
MAVTSPTLTPAPRRRRGPVIALAAGLVVLFALVALVAAALLGSRAHLTVGTAGLATLRSPRFAARVDGVSAHDASGREIALVQRDGQLYPRRKLAVGERVVVEVRVRRAGWTAWALGRERTLRLTLTTPSASVVDRWPTVPAGRPVQVRFDHPVSAVAFSLGDQDRRVALRRPLDVINLGEQSRTGHLTIAAVPRAWEKLPAAQRVTWFPADSAPTAIVTPGAGSALTPSSPITVVYSRRPKAMPTLTADGHGRWRAIDAHTVRYEPRGAGFPLGTKVALKLPGGAQLAGGATSTAWTVPPGSTLRLQQLLAGQGYLPLDWQPAAAPVAATATAQQKAAVDAPDGTFAWRWATTPAALKRLWKPGSYDDVTRGAVMAFESDHGLDVDGLVGPRVWSAILADAVAGKRSSAGYSYVLVHRDVPQSLTLWHNGKTVLETPANSGVPQAPTQLGTFPVYLRLRTQTMTGTNPDGSHYSDPGIKWISYFNGGDAIHGFERASYGTPQSVGCVELPVPTAGRVWPYTPIGTLVTIAH